MDANVGQIQGSVPIQFDNSYARLPQRFYSKLAPEPVSEPGLIRVNDALAGELGIDTEWLRSSEGLAFLAGNELPAGAEPLAMTYAGHQFGGWVPQLGDGRAILLGEVIGSGGRRYDIQLKGSGRTPYSRGGDGRAPLGPVLREYLISEAMSALGVPTTRALAAVSTGDRVFREQALPGAVLARVAASHIRIGTLQYFAARQDREALEALVEHVIERHYPEAADTDNPPLALFENVISAQAALIARWQCLGFIHGVMNTDNMLLSGETIDYGPCAFMDHYNPAQVYSSIDHGGRYAYRNQPAIAHWNLSCLAGTLLPLLDADEERAREIAQEALNVFPKRFMESYRRGMMAKLGLSASTAEDGQPRDEPSADDALVNDLLSLMAETRSDFTLTFRRLADLADGEASRDGGVEALFEFPDEFHSWLERWRQRLSGEPGEGAARQSRMKVANPVYIPRNHLVEEAIEAAVSRSDFEPFHRLVDVLSRPHEFEEALERFALPPRPEQVVQRTFCGT